ncbi:rCG47338 [Rattus norvegicus]|uniref:RCG47338 n=1 Tax=Rattus norvegicus TaxID=10116 RepID=A6HXW3_RAT|nr:rCG47338 [Rattus norvegicus]
MSQATNVLTKFYMYGCFACMPMYHVCACYLWRPEEGIRSFGTAGINGC